MQRRQRHQGFQLVDQCCVNAGGGGVARAAMHDAVADGDDLVAREMPGHGRDDRPRRGRVVKTLLVPAPFLDRRPGTVAQPQAG